MSKSEENKSVDRSRLMILGSLGAAAASGACASTMDTSGVGRQSQEMTDRFNQRQRAEEAARRERARAQANRRAAPARPAGPPMIERSGEGGGGGGGSH